MMIVEDDYDGTYVHQQLLLLSAFQPVIIGVVAVRLYHMRYHWKWMIDNDDDDIDFDGNGVGCGAFLVEGSVVSPR